MESGKPPVDDAPSAAELEFIERIRTDRARGRALRRRAALVGTTMLVVVVGPLLLTRGAPQAPVGPGIRPAEAPVPLISTVDVSPVPERVGETVEYPPTRIAPQVAHPVAVRTSRRQISLRDGRIAGRAGSARLGPMTEAP